MTFPLRSDATVDELLDAGATGMRYFAEFLPRAEKLAPVGVTYEQLCAHYDQQRGMNLHLLEQDADILARALTDSDAQFEAQHGQVGSLPAAWTGAAAEVAGRSLDEHLRRARAGMRAARDVHGAMVGAGCCLRELVARKAEAVAGLHQGTIGERSPEELDAVIAGAALCPGDNATGLLRRLVDYFPDLDAVLPPEEQVAPILGDAARQAVVDRCRTWLDEVFIPHVTTSVETFLLICSATDGAVTAVYEELTKAFSAIDDSALPTAGFPTAAYPTPRDGVQTSVSPLSAPATLPPGTVGTRRAEWGSGIAPSGLGARPEHAVGAAGKDATAQDLGAAVRELAGAVLELSTAAVTEVTELLGEGRPPDTPEPEPAPEPEPPDGPLSEAVVERQSSPSVVTGGPVEFEVAGRTLRIEPALGSEALAVKVMGEGRVLRTFDLTLDEDGMPKLTEAESAGDACDAAGQQPSADSAGPAESAGPAPPGDTEDAPRIEVVPSPALPAPAPHTQRSEAIMTAAPTDEPAGIGDEGIPDTGVALAEAGPL